MWRPIATIAAAARDVELEEPVLKLCWYSIYINLVLNIFIFLGGGPTLISPRLPKFSSWVEAHISNIVLVKMVIHVPNFKKYR